MRPNWLQNTNTHNNNNKKVEKIPPEKISIAWCANHLFNHKHRLSYWAVSAHEPPILEHEHAIRETQPLRCVEFICKFTHAFCVKASTHHRIYREHQVKLHSYAELFLFHCEWKVRPIGGNSLLIDMCSAQCSQFNRAEYIHAHIIWSNIYSRCFLCLWWSGNSERVRGQVGDADKQETNCVFEIFHLCTMTNAKTHWGNL